MTIATLSYPRLLIRVFALIIALIIWWPGAKFWRSLEAILGWWQIGESRCLDAQHAIGSAFDIDKANNEYDCQAVKDWTYAYIPLENVGCLKNYHAKADFGHLIRHDYTLICALKQIA